MKSTDVIQPVAMATPIAVSGSKDDIPQQQANVEFPWYCSIEEGFPDITMTALNQGGRPPRGQGMNGLLNIVSDQKVYLQNGGLITYKADVAAAIGGYPQGAILAYIDNSGKYRLVRSIIDDNSNNFIADETLIDGTNWEEIQIGSSGGGGSRNIGEIVGSVLPLVDAGLHLLDGALVQGSGIYDDFVNYISRLYTDNPNANYFTTESDWQSSVTNYGVCGKFVYNSTNNTVRLPKITGIIEGTTDLNALGDLIQAGLPSMTTNTTDAHTHGPGTQNITGTFSAPCAQGTSATSGAFTNSTRIAPMSSGDDWAQQSVTFDASRSWTGETSSNGNHNHIVNTGVGVSSTVQPQTIKAFYYIVIATSTKTEIQVDIDEVVTDLNDKADVDLANLSSSGKLVLDGQYIDKNNTNIINFGPTTSGTYSGSIDLSSLIPDNGVYECAFNVHVSGYNPSTSNGGELTCALSSVGFSKIECFLMPQLTNNLSGQIILPIKNKTVSYSIVFVNISNGTCTVNLSHYRRIGTNV